jgi:hypothetical protein
MKINYITDVMDNFLAVVRLSQESRMIVKAWFAISKRPYLKSSYHFKQMLKFLGSRTYYKSLSHAKKVLDYSTDTYKMVDALAGIYSIQSRKPQAVSDGIESVNEILDVLSMSDPLIEIPDEIRTLLEKIKNGQTTSEIIVNSMLLAFEKINKENLAAMTRRLVNMRIDALHASILIAINKRVSDDSYTGEDLDETRKKLSAITSNQIEAFKKLARGIDETIKVVWPVSLIQFIVKSEGEFTGTMTAGIVNSLFKAKAGSSSELRKAALIYDDVRRSLANISAAYDLLLAWATHDYKTLKAWKKAAEHKTASATLDLPRTKIRDVLSKKVENGSLIELDGVIRRIQTKVSANKNESRFVIADENNELLVYAPHYAVDSFGITTGIWCQVRGTLYLDGKDDMAEPLVMLRRIQLGQAAEQSFLDFVTDKGKAFFSYRPHGLDMMAGRDPLNSSSVNEILIWNVKHKGRES